MNILIIRLSALGDIIHSLPVAEYLKATIPNLRLTWMVEPIGADLLRNNPLIDELIVFEKKRFKQNIAKPWLWLATMGDITQLATYLRQRQFDAVLDMQGLLKSGLLAFLSGAKKRFGFASAREGAVLLMTDTLDVGDYFFGNEHIVNLNLKLANFMCRKLGFSGNDIEANLLEKQEFKTPLPAVSADLKQKFLNLLPESNISTVVLVPGTTWSSKVWDAQKWADLACKIANHKKCRIVLIGTNSEKNINEQIAKQLQVCLPNQEFIDLTGLTSLLDLIVLFENADLVIGADTGPLHLAAAVNKPKTIGIFGSSPYKRNGPYGKKGQSISLHLSCQPCFEKKCPLSTNACLMDLDVDTVFSQLENSLS